MAKTVLSRCARTIAAARTEFVFLPQACASVLKGLLEAIALNARMVTRESSATNRRAPTTARGMEPALPHLRAIAKRDSLDGTATLTIVITIVRTMATALMGFAVATLVGKGTDAPFPFVRVAMPPFSLDRPALDMGIALAPTPAFARKDGLEMIVLSPIVTTSATAMVNVLLKECACATLVGKVSRALIALARMIAVDTVFACHLIPLLPRSCMPSLFTHLKNNASPVLFMSCHPSSSLDRTSRLPRFLKNLQLNRPLKSLATE